MKPYEEGAFKAPSISEIKKMKAAVPKTQSKRMFMYGGGNSAFA
jgi:hypothetical protein